MPKHGACQPTQPKHHSYADTYTRHNTAKHARDPIGQEANKAHERIERRHVRTARRDKSKHTWDASHDSSRDKVNRT